MVSPCIRPVTGCLPLTKELWEDTNLPLCVVVTPLANNDEEKDIEEEKEEEQDDEEEEEEEEEEEDDGEENVPKDNNRKPRKEYNNNILRPLSSIPKCLHCGAPHPTKETHFRPSNRPILLCYLCGETSSLLMKDQEAEREDEVFDANTYDRYSFAKGKDHIFEITNDKDQAPKPVPAMTCPPVWWIVLDDSQTQRHDYWSAVGTALETALADIPPYVHVGMVAAGSTTLSSWDLSSPIPHVVKYPYTSSDIDFCLVPADSLHLTSIQSAIRAATDAHASGTLGSASADNTGMSLGLTIELILEYMEQATHPGDNPQDDDDEDTPKSPLKYAGGKILCLLGNPPAEINSKVVESQPNYYQGGVAGACSPDDKWEGNFVPESEPTDMTPENLENFAEPLDPEDLFDTLGTRCASAALGVDLFVVVPEYGIDADADAIRTSIRPFYGLPLLRILSDASGAPGPLMFGTQDIDGLEENIFLRTPWQPDMVFSAEMRIRVPPGFQVESAPIDPIGKSKMQVATLLSSGGVAGPAVAVDDNLWLLGTCDAFTTLTVDLEVDKEVPEEYTVKGIGEIPAKPVIQFCFAYTCIEEDEDGNAYTARRMKIFCREMPLTSEAEEIYNKLDVEALMVPLYHKLCLNAIQEGLEEAQETGLKWLVSLLVCVYQSAIVEQARLEEMKEQQGHLMETGSTFVACERLLDEEGGDLSIEDVLLGQGHEKIAEIAVLIYAMLQCDALRPTCGSFQPSMDGRCAAMAQMASMTPYELKKCIAPTLQLWSTTKDEPIMESLRLNKRDMQDVLEDIRERACVLLLDSPQGIILCRSERLSTRKNIPSGKVQVGPNLEAAMEEAAETYRLKPSIGQELDPRSTKLANLLANYLVEDKGLATGVQDFAEWKTEVAAQVQESLVANGDIEAEEENEEEEE